MGVSSETPGAVVNSPNAGQEGLVRRSLGKIGEVVGHLARSSPVQSASRYPEHDLPGGQPVDLELRRVAVGTGIPTINLLLVISLSGSSISSATPAIVTIFGRREVSEDGDCYSRVSAQAVRPPHVWGTW